MKEKIIIFITGLLIGAIISTGSIYFYIKANSTNNQEIQNGMNNFDRRGDNQNIPPEFNEQGQSPRNMQQNTQE